MPLFCYTERVINVRPDIRQKGILFYDERNKGKKQKSQSYYSYFK